MNKANYSIGCYFSLGGDGIFYPDSLPATDKHIVHDIKTNTEYYYDSSLKWDVIYSSLPHDTMSVFIFHSDTLKKYTWEDVRNGYKILKRYDLSLEDLKQMNWKITYP